MTKQDFETGIAGLNKKIDAMNELLIRNDEKLIGIKNQLSEGSKKFEDHEVRMRILELWKSRVIGYALGAGAIAGIIVGLIRKFLGI